MKFSYKAKTKQGQTQSGTIEASSKEAALALLQRYNLFVTFLEEITKKPFYLKPLKLLERISGKDLVLFSRQMATLLGSKVPVVEALAALAYQTKNPSLKRIISKVTEEVEGGTSLSKALSSYPQVFSKFYVAMLKSGEVAGRLPESIEYLADHLEREYDFYSKIRGAMVYPVFVLLVFSFVLLALIFFIVPQLSEVLKEAGQTLPLFTQKLLDSADFLKAWGLTLLFASVLAMVGLYQYYRSRPGKEFFDRFFLALPGLGDFLKKLHLSYLGENLSTLIAGGLPIGQALKVTEQILGNNVYQKILAQTREGVRRGESMSAVFQRHPDAFPPLFVQMTMVGERAGKVDAALMNVGRFYRKEVDRTLNSLSTLLEPLLIVILGLMIGGLVIAILMPLYQVGI